MVRSNEVTRATVALALCLLAAGACSAPGRDATRPSVLLVTLDTTRADHLGCYGREPTTSPHLDALAADGVRFDLALSTSAATPISHASILTGLNPPGHGVRVIAGTDHFRLRDGVRTMADVLREGGWRTGAFLSSFTVSEYYGFDRGFDAFDNGMRSDASAALRADDSGLKDWDVHANQRRSDETTDRAIEWIEGAEGPFFAWVHYWDPHDPLLMPPPEVVERFVEPGQSRLETTIAGYDAEIYWVDAQIGRLLESLEAAGIGDDTIVVVVADHGEGLGDHGWMYHRILYQEQIRVPLIVRYPGGPTARVVDEMVRTIDILPTVLELAGVDGEDPIDGASLLRLIRGEPDAVTRIAYADSINAWDENSTIARKRPKDVLLHAVSDGTWKLIHRPDFEREDELYHLGEDPRELNNLHRREPEVVARLEAELERFDGFLTEADFAGDALDDDTRKRLESLGYVGD